MYQKSRNEQNKRVIYGGWGIVPKSGGVNKISGMEEFIESWENGLVDWHIEEEILEEQVAIAARWAITHTKKTGK